jgi:hypothetical protein
LSYHSDKSRAVISEAIAEGKRQGYSGRALGDFVSTRYPFEIRDTAAFKVWRAMFNVLMKPELPPAAVVTKWFDQ